MRYRSSSQFVLIYLTFIFVTSATSFQNNDRDSTTASQFVNSRIDFHKIVFNLLDCESNSIVLLSDNNDYVDVVLNHLTKHSVVFTHWNEDNAIFLQEDVVRLLTDVYVMYPRTMFVLLLEHPETFLKMVDFVAEDKSRGRLSLMRHNTQWVVAAWSDKQMERVTVQQRSSVLDNVAVLFISNTIDKRSFTVHNIITFMWRNNRTRKPQKVISDSFEEKCIIHPNKQFGLNGRNIETVVKPFFETLLSVKINPATNSLEYSGQLIDLLSYVATRLNFTYSLWPPAGKSVFSKWTEYGTMISNGSFDVGINVWSLLYGGIGPYSVTYPVNFDVITGLYRTTEPSEREASKYLLFPFPKIIYLGIFSAVVATAILYMITLLPNRKEGNGKREQKPSKWTITFNRFIDILGKLLASAINQNYLPNPMTSSSRILLGCWSLTIVILYALDTGFITANMVKQDHELPFQTFEQMVARGDYQAGTIEHSIISRVMNTTSTGTIGLLGRYVKRVLVDETLTAGKIVDTAMPKGNDKFVLIYYAMALREWLEKQDNPGRYTMMDRYLIHSNAGLLLQAESDLAHLLSHQIMRMHETGLLPENHRGSGSKYKLAKVNDSRNVTKKALKFVDFYWPFIWVIYLLTISSVVLVAEIVFNRWRWAKEIRLNVEE